MLGPLGAEDSPMASLEAGTIPPSQWRLSAVFGSGEQESPSAIRRISGHRGPEGSFRGNVRRDLAVSPSPVAT